jgi:hypothetical protein
VLLLLTNAEATLSRYPSPLLGRLLTPRHYDGVAQTEANGRPWAADNDCFQGLDANAYRRMLHVLPPTGQFVTVPDVVADHRATLRRWRRWTPLLHRLGHRPAFVLQDGCDRMSQVPDDAGAVFIGGSTAYNLGVGSDLAREAKDAGLWVHMGRVNTLRRLVWAQSIGCDSVDGTKWVKWRDHYLSDGLRFLELSGTQASFAFGGAA